ncbi:cytochrome c oxidase subunit 7A2, mitochondrial isoform X1 [Carassius carassius]|uniref:cytochrome c oxidase subunit 7A2, mitochondrial isoform X1 n=2 Tax=Carassius TaxID=7956 RepID=UPI0028695F34|nr:cytochrome c oxidase subunit 7A2, mitochondrial isoform X1 [Carassius carassius]
MLLRFSSLCLVTSVTHTSVMFRHFLTLQQVSRRQISSTVRRQLVNKVPDKQKLFQEANGMPVHLKGGVGDAVLYRATMGLTVLGTAFVIYELVKAALPQKKD